MEEDLSVDVSRFKYFATINIPFENSNDASKFIFSTYYIQNVVSYDSLLQ